MHSFQLGNAIMFSHGQAAAQGFSVLGSYHVTDDHSDWGWRTAVQVLGEDEIIFTAYNITPDGQEAKGVETVYTRIKPQA